MNESLPMQLCLGFADADAEELHDLALSLRGELLGEFAVEPLPCNAETAPQNAKGDLITVGVLALAVLPALLPKLVEYLQHWTMRGQGRSMRIKVGNGDKVVEVELTNSNESLDRLFAFASEETMRLARQVPI